MTSAELVEQMAYERIEPYGAIHDEFIGGQLCALTANLHRDPKNGNPLNAGDFMPALGRLMGKGDEPISLDDPDKQSELLEAFFRAAGSAND